MKTFLDLYDAFGEILAGTLVLLYVLWSFGVI